jgi:hypothetical protein
MTNFVSQVATSIGVNLDSETGGRHAIAGFLLQILRSIKLGLDMSLAFSSNDAHAQMVLHLEPAEGSDHRIVGGPIDIVEQVKMRSTRRKWTAGEIAADVFPDLLKAVRLSAEQRFRFVTNNPAGLSSLESYVANRGGHPTRKYRWSSSWLTTTQLEERLAKSAGVGMSAELRHLLDRFEIVIVGLDDTERKIDEALTPLLKDGEVALAEANRANDRQAAARLAAAIPPPSLCPGSKTSHVTRPGQSSRPLAGRFVSVVKRAPLLLIVTFCCRRLSLSNGQG